jgi:acyl-homoserine-lactone acylase
MNSMRTLRARGALLAAAVVAAACSSMFTRDARIVQIQRTTHGVAHIEAPDYESLAYGVAYAHAQDNVCQTADHLLTIRGERSRFHGPSANGLLGLRPLPNEQIDRFIRAHMDDAALAAANAQASADTKAMANGYVAGYNRFLRDNAARIPQPCKGQPWLRPMTIADFHRLNELLAIQLGIGTVAGGIVAAVPPVAGGQPAAPRSELPPPADVRVALDEHRLAGPALGSNGWAFGADTTDNGRGVLLGNPHFPWIGANRFWQMHLTIPGKLDVMGVTIGNSPLVVIGFNHDVAWTHTVSTARRFTLFELTLAPGDPTSYIIDGKPEKMRATAVRIDVRGADGQVTTKESTQWSTRWGPLFVLPRAGLEWTATTAYALKDATTLDGRFADTWLGIDRAKSVGEVRAAISNVGASFVNTIAADRNGDVMYADISIVPNVDTELLQRCAPGRRAAGLFANAGIVVLNGSRSDCDWKRDSAAAAPGLTPVGRLPVLTRRDWVQNSNDSYWLANPAAKLTGFSPVIGTVDTAQGMRTRAGIALINARLANGRMSAAEAARLVLANRNQLATIVLDDLLAACSDAPSQPSKDGCSALSKWDRTNNLESRGSHVFREWWQHARGIAGIWRLPFDRADPLNTPAGLNMNDAAVRAKVWEAMEKAVADISAAGFALDARLSDVQGRSTTNGRIALHGGTSNEGVLNIVEGGDAMQPLGKNGYVPTFGTSYLQVVTFDERGPVADALLTYGQSSHADSPYAFDQLPLFARKEFPRLPFHPDDVARQRIGEVLRLDVH